MTTRSRPSFRSALLLGAAAWTDEPPPSSGFWSQAYSVLTTYMGAREQLKKGVTPEMIAEARKQAGPVGGA